MCPKSEFHDWNLIEVFEILWNVELPIKWQVRISAWKAEFQLEFN